MSRMQRIDVPDFETIWPRLQPQVEQLAERQEARRGSSGSQALKVISMLLGLILAFIGLFSLLNGNLFGLVLFAIGALLVLAPLRWLKNYLTESRSDSAENVVEPLVDTLIKEMAAQPLGAEEARLQASYELDGRIPAPVLKQSRFIADTSIPQEDLISGTFGATDFMLGDLKWEATRIPESDEARERREKKRRRELASEYNKQHSNSDGYRAKDRKHYIDQKMRSGTGFEDTKLGRQLAAKLKEYDDSLQQATGSSMVFFSADFHKEFTSSTMLLPQQESMALRRISDETAEKLKVEPLRLEDTQITKFFHGWTDDQTEARYLVTPELMVALNELIERLGTKHVAVSFSQSRMFIAAVLDRNYFSLDSVQSLNDGKAEVKEIYEDLVYFLSLVEHFNLNTRIWSKV